MFYFIQARSRYKFSSGRVFIPVYEVGKRPAAQCRGISYPGATNCLGIENFITCSGAYPGLRFSTDPGKRLRISKKHDKQLTFIVRVMVSLLNTLSGRICLGSKVVNLLIFDTTNIESLIFTTCEIV
jgi:hypothetical protein